MCIHDFIPGRLFICAYDHINTYPFIISSKSHHCQVLDYPDRTWTACQIFMAARLCKRCSYIACELQLSQILGATINQRAVKFYILLGCSSLANVRTIASRAHPQIPTLELICTYAHICSYNFPFTKFSQKIH